jgi:hypothetical protein
VPGLCTIHLIVIQSDCDLGEEEFAFFKCLHLHSPLLKCMHSNDQ